LSLSNHRIHFMMKETKNKEDGDEEEEGNKNQKPFINSFMNNAHMKIE